MLWRWDHDYRDWRGTGSRVGHKQPDMVQMRRSRARSLEHWVLDQLTNWVYNAYTGCWISWLTEYNEYIGVLDQLTDWVYTMGAGSADLTECIDWMLDQLTNSVYTVCIQWVLDQLTNWVYNTYTGCWISWLTQCICIFCVLDHLTDCMYTKCCISWLIPYTSYWLNY